MKQHFDCIIAGGGCSGLSLAYYLVDQGYQGDVLILDREQKSNNDRTWCWWSNSPTPFDSLFTHQWQYLKFADDRKQRIQPIDPYRYCLLRSADFYHFIQQRLVLAPNVTWLQADIHSIEDAETGAIVLAGDTFFSAEWVFSSIQKIPDIVAPNPKLYQHFAGWWIETAEDRFDPSCASIMDFRVPQRDNTRFCYVLPTSARRALVEFTVFSTGLLGEKAYEAALEAYLIETLEIERWEICEKEFGVIPMHIMESKPKQKYQHIFQIGTTGGAVKPSTGYAFARIQEQTKQVAQQLVAQELPNPRLNRPNRFEFYDQLLLHILTHRGGLGSTIFSRLFQHIDFPLILKFLDEDTQLTEEFGILASLPPGPFLQAVWESYLGSNKFVPLPPNPVHQ
ncbi:MAG TPA: lycopene cyclase family protein [Haliscomenobacter sp.]|uniref:lycopene cyclase family protein n=1 Tax=Haliscomenobacter sp. TaxID=2717303 RepID=UPI002CDEF942|nr:lycopene cyclase family protein [Haliscomenobacter sp.]HOY18012.1 lycopene cyclase family protein [Haliscomenobacter sp.]HPH20401.1 lycopene cyclase family protein [Haliscomenobacter sp.]